MAIEVKLKRWGNSMGVILPRDFIEKKGLKEEENLVIEVVKPANLKHVFGSSKGRKMSGEEFKEMVRKGWNK